MDETSQAGSDVPTDRARRWFPRTLVKQLDLLVKLGLIGGGILAGVQYFEAKEEQRISRTLLYADRFEVEPLWTARQRLLEAFRSITPLVSEAEALGLGPEAVEALNSRIAQFFQSEAGGEGVAPEIDQIVSFFDSLANCVEANLCDRTTARASLGDQAEILRTNLDAYIGLQRVNRSATYAAGLLALTGPPTD